MQPMTAPTETEAVDVEKARSSEPAGTTGVVAYGGYVQSGETSPALIGRAKWVTYTNAQNMAVVATGVRYFGNLLAGTEWHAEPNPEGGKNAQKGADIVTRGLLEAPMQRPWPMIVRKASMYRWSGFSLHACGIARRPDGLIVFSDIAHRPQHTIEKWMRRDETSPFTGVEQRSPLGELYPIDLSECLYCVDDLLGDGPEGVGLLRHVIELVRRLGLYETLEGSAYFQDIAGLPIAEAPIEEIINSLGTKDEATIRRAIAQATQKIQDAVANRVRSPEKLQWLMLDSATYRGTNPDTISAIKKWGITVLKGETANLANLNTTIARVGLEIARVLGIEFAMVGGGDSAGSYGMHEDKTSMFATNLQTTLVEISNFAERQLARRLVALNGLDPDTCTPKLVAEPISTDAIEAVCRALRDLSMAGLSPDDPAIPVLRKRMRLPPAPNVSESLMIPRTPKPARGKGNEPPKPADMTPVEPGKANAP